jgi:MFS family permease
MVTVLPTVDASGADEKPAVSNGFIAIYVLAQFGIWLALLTPVVLTIALRVGEIAGEAGKARSLGTVLAIGAFFAVVSAPIWGALSDRTRSRFGRRRPWLVGGLVCSGIGLVILGSAQSIWMVGIGWLLCQASFNAMEAAIMAILPDVVPSRQQGRVSGLLGMTTTAGVFVGTWLTQYTQSSSMMMFLEPYAITVVTVMALVMVLRDAPLEGPAPPMHERGVGRLLASMVTPFRDADFNWAFVSRFLIMLAWFFLLTYQLFFLTDRLGLDRAAALAVMVKSSAVIAIATVSMSIVGGVLSDLIGRRKPIVFAAAAIEGVGFLLIATTGTVDQFLVGVAVASLGKGLYFGVDLALVAAILPSRKDAAKDLGIFQIANSMPQSVAPGIAPILLAIGATAGAAGGNYPVLYVVAALCSIIGAAAILPVKRSR